MFQPASVDGLVVLSLLDLAAAQKATQNRTELRKKAHEYAMVAEKIGSHLLTSTGSSKAAMINHGTAIAMAMNHLANQAFYTWKVLDHHAHASQQAGELILYVFTFLNCLKKTPSYSLQLCRYIHV